MNHRVAFDLVVASTIGGPTLGWWQSLKCSLGFHMWGYCRCPSCGTDDLILCEQVDEQWALMTETEQVAVEKKARALLEEMVERV